MLLAVPAAFPQPSAMHLRILVVKDAAAARQVTALLAQGEPFARLASEHSIHLSKKRGGRLGRVALEELQEQVRVRIGTLKVGGVIGPVQVREGLAFFQRSTAAYYAEAIRLIRAKQYREALASLAKDLALNPDRLHSLELKAYAHEQLRQMAEAEVVYREIILRQPENILAHNNLGALFEQSGQYARAARLFEQAIILDPSQDVILYNLAWLYAVQLSKPGKALGFIRKAIARQPDTARYYDVLGRIYKQQGKQQQARLAFAKAAELAPHETKYQDGLASLSAPDTPWQPKKTAAGLQPISQVPPAIRRSKTSSALIKVVVHPGGTETSRRITQLLQQNGFLIDRHIKDAEPRQGLQIYHKPRALGSARMIRDLISPGLQPRRLTWPSQFDIIIYAGR
jgi:tetratricopeptide (TPR) repeat protein